MRNDHCDSEWLRGIREGDFDVYRAVFDHYAPQLIRFAQLSVPFDAAEDIVQDVLFNLWRLRTTLVAHEGITVYLFGAVRNRVTSYLRHERVVRRLKDGEEDVSSFTMSETPPSPDSVVISSDFATGLRHLLGRLSPQQREVITLRWEHEMTYEQIAATLSITVAAARQHGSRAQRVLRPYVERFLSANSPKR